MSKAKTPRNRARGTKARSAGHYQVGYGRPPRAHQFKPGRSGNPKGRPKGAKNEDTILFEIMNRPIEIREGGRARKISVLAAILLKFAESALRGDPKSAAFLLNRYGLAERNAPQTDGLNQDDRELLDSYIRDLKPKMKGTK
jgi:Family of unknown function (DUF5681)